MDGMHIFELSPIDPSLEKGKKKEKEKTHTPPHAYTHTYMYMQAYESVGTWWCQRLGCLRVEIRNTQYS